MAPKVGPFRLFTEKVAEPKPGIDEVAEEPETVKAEVCPHENPNIAKMA